VLSEVFARVRRLREKWLSRPTLKQDALQYFERLEASNESPRTYTFGRVIFQRKYNEQNGTKQPCFSLQNKTKQRLEHDVIFF